jgi:hypothetical protein
VVDAGSAVAGWLYLHPPDEGVGQVCCGPAVEAMVEAGGRECLLTDDQLATVAGAVHTVVVSLLGCLRWLGAIAI